MTTRAHEALLEIAAAGGMFLFLVGLPLVIFVIGTSR